MRELLSSSALWVVYSSSKIYKVIYTYMTWCPPDLSVGYASKSEHSEKESEVEFNQQHIVLLLFGLYNTLIGLDKICQEKS
tara:strand:+ start:244 stop:486 length:243 start_codon:yes stop_codon:yes gene_type:complete